MKRWVWGAMLFAGVFSLYAQSPNQAGLPKQTGGQVPKPENVFIHIPPVTGESGSRRDGAYISGLLTEEVKIRDYVIISSPKAADFLLIGALAPYTETKGEDLNGWEADEWDYGEDETFGNVCLERKIAG